ncbi:MAG: hypothetical protein AVDCRST_MAG69-2418 [uncultured Solirubrobacteraceae bacterium]|uniref:YlxP-like protein n=1 Tax=uncultured Solirubrobacteraceae bacterium TaxID=1162706 RepID=A0A6J4SZK6_9ACTN|nr:MAG: hypothetical protein AVDCRST_MAG69-2418 [uncultured Solirubrobacteraceae bacterium]
MPEPFVVLMRVHLHLPDAHSLKAKRSEVNPVKAWLRQRLGAAVAEVCHHDAWQRSMLAVSVCGDSPARCQEAVDSIRRYLDQRFPDGVRVDERLVSWSDLEGMR